MPGNQGNQSNRKLALRLGHYRRLSAPVTRKLNQSLKLLQLPELPSVQLSRMAPEITYIFALAPLKLTTLTY